MKVELRRATKTAALEIRVVAESPADRLALVTFLAGANPERTAMGFSSSGSSCGMDEVGDNLGPEWVAFRPYPVPMVGS